MIYLSNTLYILLKGDYMLTFENQVDSQKFIQVVRAIGTANTYSELELGYIYHGLDDMGVDPQLFFNYDLNVIVRAISDILLDFNHEQLVDICVDLAPNELKKAGDSDEMYNEELIGYILECDRYQIIDELNPYLHNGYYLIHPDGNKLFEFLKSADE